MKKHFLKSFALIAMLFSVLTVSAGTELFNPATTTISEVFIAYPDWVSDGVSSATYDANTGVISVDIKNQLNGQWKGQVKLQHDITFAAGKKYQCSMKFRANTAVNGVTLKIDDNTGMIFEDQAINIPANEDYVYTSAIVDGAAGNNKIIVFDFGWAPVSQITISNISIQEVEEQGGGESEKPEVGSIDWESINWVEASDNKFKVYSECLTAVINVQQPGWAAERGIYVTVPAGISSCTVNGAIDGAGMVLYLSSFTAKETEVTITHGLGSCTFWVYYADGTTGETPGEGGGDGLIATEYCDYTCDQLTKDGVAITLTWETAENGDVVITMGNGVGAESCSFRNGGFEGGIEAFVVSTDNFATTTPAANYFTFTKVYDGNEARLVKIADLEKGVKIKYGKEAAFSWKANGVDRWDWLDFIYTYGGVCNKLDAPINVAVTEAGVITFDEVIGANAYEVRVYQGAMLKYTQEIVNGGTINFVAYVDGEYLVKVVAKGEGKGESSESDPVSWNVKASPLPMSNYCETLADDVTANNGSCSPLFTWITDAAGNVVITVSASEGNEGETMFRNNGMNGAFSLDGSVENFNAYFDRAKTDDYTYTLTLKDAANKPLPGAVISFSGQIEAKSSINNNDWSNYVFNGYLYGTNCTIEDNVKPVMGTATLLSNNYDVAIIEVSASDNIEVAKYRVVDESNGYNKSFKPADGKITVTHLTPSTKYTLTITALDFADNESENSATVEVTTEAHNYKPTVAPAAPSVAEKKVISLYSDAYATTNNFTAHEAWYDATIYQELDLEGNKVRYYTNLNYLGWQFTSAPINALNMEKLHLDIWAEFDGSLKVTPIYGGEGLTTDDSKGKVVELKGQQWNNIDFELTEFAGLNWSSIFQFKFDLPVGGTTFAIDNVYFYRETEIADTEAPTDVVATLKSASYTSVVITCQAADNSGTVSFDIFDGENKVATSGAESGKPVDVTVAGLEAGKTYNLSVVAYDFNENKAAAVSVEAATLALPVAAPAPTQVAEDVYAIYSDAYTSPVYFIIGAWQQATVVTEVNLAAEDKAYLLQKTNYLGWEINNNQPFDVSAYNKFHIDIYALAESTLQITPISEGPKEKLQTLTLKEGWNQIDMDCATFEGVEFDKVIQIKFDGGGNATYFIDNVYFYKASISDDPTNVENNTINIQSQKIIRNGQLIIIRGGVSYDLMGRIVR